MAYSMCALKDKSMDMDFFKTIKYKNKIPRTGFTQCWLSCIV